MTFLDSFKKAIKSKIEFDFLYSLVDEKLWLDDPKKACIASLEKSKLFDCEAYLNQYIDVANAGANPIEHFVKYGIREGRILFVQRKEDFIQEKKYILNRYQHIFEKYKEYSSSKKIEKKEDFPIFFCWFQGLQKMPYIVQKCYEQLQLCADGYRIVFIDKNTYSSYIDLPGYVLDTFSKGSLRIQHLTDILRVGLLCFHGGLWVDATVYITDYFENHPEILHNDYFSLGRWVSFLNGTSIRENTLYKILYDLLLEYVRDNDEFRIYLVLDAIVSSIYEKNMYVRNMFDTCKNSLGKHRFYFWKNRDREIDDSLFENIIKDVFVAKLTYKFAIDTSNTNTVLYKLLSNKWLNRKKRLGILDAHK